MLLNLTQIFFTVVLKFLTQSVKIFLLSQNLMRQTNVSHKILWTRNNEKFRLT